MIKKTGFLKKIAAVTSIAAAFAVLLGTTPALATTVNVVPVLVQYYLPTPSAPVLIIQSGGVNYLGQVGAPAGCTSHTVDTLKAWQSLAQAALLSGRQVQIDYNDCGTPTVHTMYAVTLK